jgi:hypothetical protein
VPHFEFRLSVESGPWLMLTAGRTSAETGQSVDGTE